jgi:hypothetical protein
MTIIDLPGSEINRTMGTLLSIVATQSPIDIGPDSGGRTQYSVNFELTNLLEDPVELIISNILSAPPISIPSSNILLGSSPVDPLITQAARENPITDGPYVRVLSTGGYGSTIARGEGANSSRRLDRPSVQLLISSLDSATAASTAISIWTALNGARHISY